MTTSVHIQQPHDPGIRMTDAAKKHVALQLAKHENSIGLRLSVKTTGCSGYSYVVELIDKPVEGDWKSQIDEKITVFVDANAATKLRGTEIDYVREGLSARFEFNNPNEQNRCGCGESFSV